MVSVNKEISEYKTTLFTYLPIYENREALNIQLFQTKYDYEMLKCFGFLF